MWPLPLASDLASWVTGQTIVVDGGPGPVEHVKPHPLEPKANYRPMPCMTAYQFVSGTYPVV